MAGIFAYAKQPVTLATVWLVAACGAAGPEDPLLLTERDRGPAVLAFFGDTTVVQLAASTRVGEPTALRFFSFGGGCIRQGTTEVAVSGLSAEVRPYHLEPPASTVCTSDLRLDLHRVQLRFAAPGRARVRIVGLARPGEQVFVVERNLLVAP